jgi:hypothetical protein
MVGVLQICVVAMAVKEMYKYCGKDSLIWFDSSFVICLFLRYMSEI